MAKVYITEHTAPTLSYGNSLPVAYMPPLATQVVAIGGASVQSAAFNANTRMVAVHTDAICSVEFGSNPTSTANSRRLAANTTEYFEVSPSQKVAVITNT
jgi:hypothetical protein